MDDLTVALNGEAGAIRGVLLDFGEVLCHKPTPESLARMADALGLAHARFVARYSEERLPYDQGLLSPVDYWSRVAADGNKPDTELVSRLRHWDVEMWSQMDPDMVGWLDRLRDSGFKTAVLSNMHRDMAAHVRRNFAWLRRVDCPILSSELHLIKPDPAIYERCLDCLKLQPSEALFIDDREANVAAARVLGLAGLRFQSVEQLRVDLARLGIPVLP
ncbi:MAG TPA: HAD family phosphatase [Terriglobia bacterium]|nr:HAD family phosphatase [Terriglobia bacterium]